MMELNTVSLNDFVKLAGVLWEKTQDTLPQYARSSGLFKEEIVPANSGNIRAWSEIDLQEYAFDKLEDEQSTRAKVQQGYTVNGTAYRIALDIGISYEMRTQNKYADVIERLTTLSTTGINRLDLDLSHRITFGTATSYTNMSGRSIDITVGDTLALFSTVHTLKGTSTTYRNRLANNPQVSKGAIEGMEQLIVENTLNQFGEKKIMKFDIIFSTDDPNTVNIIGQHLDSTADLQALNAGVTNPYNKKYRLVILPRIATDASGLVDTNKRRYWGLASSMHSTAHLGVLEEPRLKVPTTGSNAEEFSTDAWNFGMRGGWMIAIVNGAWIKFSSGDGVA